MNYSELVEYTATTFVNEYVKENGFDTFQEMYDCYGYDSEDLKIELAAIVNDEKTAFFDDETNLITLYDKRELEPISYRKFIADVKKLIKILGY